MADFPGPGFYDLYARIEKESCRVDRRERLGKDGPEASYAELVAPWLDANGATVAARFAALAAACPGPVPMSHGDLWELYAFSRVNEWLLANFQPSTHNRHWAPRASAAEYRGYIAACGLAIVQEEAFTPFLHEIVAVDQDADDTAPIRLVEELWPAVMLGPLLISRAGVRVAGGRRHVVKEVAETSRLYWAHRRRNREREDLSDGWGHNSQWRTALRRDYRLAGEWLLNTDGEVDLADLPPGPNEEGLTPADRIELLIHRCFVTAKRKDEEFWPYDDRLAVVAD